MNDAKTDPVREPGPRAMWSWALLDVATQAFATVVQTFIFAAYFTNRIAPDPETGAQWWGIATSAAGFLLALAAPVLGAVADRRGRRKPWLAFFLLLCAGATALMATVRPDPAMLPRALLLVGLGIVGVQGAGVFYNAMLSDLVPSRRTGAWSSRAWALGYLGGILALGLSLLGVDGGANRVRWIFPFVAAWTVIFSLPVMVFTPDAGTVPNESVLQSIHKGLRALRHTGKRILAAPALFRFLLARALYFDGLATVFAMGGVYAAGAFDMNEREVLLFGVALNISAGVGAAGISFIEDRVGSRRIILGSLLGLLLTLTGALLASTETVFWISGVALGIFVGPVQASSRAYLARLAPPDARAQLFGFYAFSSKATSFVGPLLVALVTSLSGSQRAGMSVVLLFFLAGALVFRTVPREHAA